MSSRFSSQDADTITCDVAAIIQRAGIRLTAKQLDALEPELLPYLHDLSQNAAHDAWTKGYRTGMTDTYDRSTNPYRLTDRTLSRIR
jgi:hypothetical protein